MFAYVGGYTTPDRNGRGEGITVYRVDPKGGGWSLIQTVGGLENPALFTLNRAQTRLYSVHGGRELMSAFAIDQQSGISTAMIALKARTAKRKFGGLDAIFVDHMHIVATDSQAERNGAARAVEKVSNDLKKLAGDMGVPVIALAQLSRGTEGREDKRPEMSDLRQSGAIEQDAEAIMLLYRGEYYLKSEPQRSGTQSITAHEKAVSEWRDAKDRLAGIAEIIIPKNRDGSPGSVQMRFDGARTAFEDAQ